MAESSLEQVRVPAWKRQPHPRYEHATVIVLLHNIPVISWLVGTLRLSLAEKAS